MDPYLANQFKSIYSKNKSWFDNKEYDKIRNEFNRTSSFNIADNESVIDALSGIDLTAAPVKGENKEAEKKKDVQNPRAEFLDAVLSGDTESLFQSEDDQFSLDSLLTENSKFTDRLLNYIGDLESNNRPNAYNGDYKKGSPVFDFQNMTLKAVLDWQENNEDKAVGRFQYKSETLKRIAEKEGISLDDLFTDEVQKKLALGSLKDRGYIEYLKDPVNNKDKFATNLAKEWASLPLIVAIDDRVVGESYYGGTNRALSDVDTFISILDYQTWKNAGSNETIKDLNHRQKLDYFDRDQLFGNITMDLLDGKSESEVEVILTNQYGNLGFKFSQAEAMEDAIVIEAPNGSKSEPIRLSRTLGESISDASDSLKNATDEAGNSLGSYSFDIVKKTGYGIGLGGSSPVNENIFEANNEEEQKGLTKITKQEELLRNGADQIKRFLRQNYVDPSVAYSNDFEQNPFKTAYDIKNAYITYDEDFIYDVNVELEQLDKQLSTTQRYNNSSKRIGYGVGLSGSIPLIEAASENEEYKRLKGEIQKRENIINQHENQKRRVSKTISTLINNSGGIDKWINTTEYGEMIFKDFIKRGIVLPEDLILPSIKIQGRPSSYSYARSILEDFTMRNAYHDGEVDIEVDTALADFGPGVLTNVAQKLTNDFDVFWNKQTHDGSFADRVDYGVRSLGIPLLATALETGINVAESIRDIASLPDQLMMYYSLPDEMSDQDKKAEVDKVFNAHYDPFFQKARAEARKIRDEQVITSGGITDSESTYEFFTKGGVAAMESLPITALFIAAPEVGLATVGLSVYSESMNQTMEAMDIYNQYKDAYGVVPIQYRGYANMTPDRARGIAVSKAVGEMAITRLFTYNYVKGALKASRGAAYVSQKEMLDLIKAYRNSFVTRGKEFYKAARVEIPEESLVTIDHMLVDDLYGVSNHSFSDYVEAVKETSTASLFTTGPLSMMTAGKKVAAANDFVLSEVSNIVMKDTEKKLHNNFGAVDNMIRQIKNRGAEPNEALKQKHEELARAVVQNYADRVNEVSLADDSDVRQLAAVNQKIKFIAESYNKEGITDKEKDIYKTQMTELVEKANLLSGRVRLEGVYQQMQEATDIVKSKYLVDVEEQDDEDKQDILDPVTEFDQSMRNAALTLATLRDNYEQGDLLSSQTDNIFTRIPETINNLITYLNSVNESSLSEDQKANVLKVIRSLKSEDGKFDPENSGLRRVVEELYGANQIISAIERAIPEDMVGKKIKPFTWLESLFMGKRRGIASTEQYIRSLFKNQKMQMPLLTLSNNIDTEILKAQRLAIDYRTNYNNLGFLDGTVTKDRRKKFESYESKIERAVLGHFGKWLDNGKQGRDAELEKSSQFLSKVEAFRNYLTKLSKEANDSKEKRKRFDAYKKIFDKIVNNSISYDDMVSKADADNVSAIDFIREMFESQAQNVFDHMRDFLGKTPTRWNRYAPTFLSNVANSKSADDMYASDFDYVRGNGPSPSTLMESGSQTEIVGDLYFDNYDQLAFKVFENTVAHVNASPYISQYKGVLNSQRFKNLFDTSRNARIYSGSKQNDYDFVNDILMEKTNRISKRLNNIGNQTQIPRDAGRFVEKLFGGISKVAATKRLATVDMRMKQAYSALFAQLPNLGSEARSFLLKRTMNFTAFRGKSHLANARYLKVLSESSTMSRGGLSAFQQGFLDQIDVEESKFGVVRGLEKVGDYVGKGADYLLENLLASSDRVAGQMTFLAFYMDYEMRNNPDVKNMNDDEFWEYTQENVSKKAIAYADTQVSISQTQSTPWNLGGIFGTGTDARAQSKMFAQIAFMFGRFAYNRKVGIANDISVLGDDFASDADKANARRRLVSAGIEIGVFKALTPTFSLIFTEMVSGLISSLLGFDDELDEIINEYSQNYGRFPNEEMSRNKMKLYNYNRDLSKEFLTSLAEGLMPTPLPGAINDAMFVGMNRSLQALGVTEEDLFNVYNPHMRGLGQEGLSPMNDSELANIIMSNSGIFELIGEDAIRLFNSAAYFSSGKLPSFSNIGKDRFVVDRAKRASDVLHASELINLLVPSADLARFNRTLRGVIERQYLTTKQDQLQAKIPLPGKSPKSRTRSEVEERLRIDELLNP